VATAVPVTATHVVAQAVGSSQPGGSTGGRLWAVARGRQVGIFRSWAAAKESTEQFSGARHKAFNDYRAAQAWLEENRDPTPATEEERLFYVAARGPAVLGPLRAEDIQELEADGWAISVHATEGDAARMISSRRRLATEVRAARAGLATQTAEGTTTVADGLGTVSAPANNGHNSSTGSSHGSDGNRAAGDVEGAGNSSK
jgi:Caulimovirus viroplasmin